MILAVYNNKCGRAISTELVKWGRTGGEDVQSRDTREQWLGMLDLLVFTRRPLIPRLFPRFLLSRLLLCFLLWLLLGLLRRRGRGGIFGDSDGRKIIPFFSEDSNNLTNWDFLGTSLYDNLAHHTIFLRFHIDRRLVRLLQSSISDLKNKEREEKTCNFQKHVTGSKALAFILLPRRDPTFSHGR